VACPPRPATPAGPPGGYVLRRNEPRDVRCFGEGNVLGRFWNEMPLSHISVGPHRARDVRVGFEWPGVRVGPLEIGD
ncbi:hypothetical protein HK097_003627, partial [Rhizophlyctis rosea]